MTIPTFTAESWYHIKGRGDVAGVRIERGDVGGEALRAFNELGKSMEGPTDCILCKAGWLPLVNGKHYMSNGQIWDCTPARIAEQRDRLRSYAVCLLCDQRLHTGLDPLVGHDIGGNVRWVHARCAERTT